MKLERVVIEDPDMGTVICWKVGSFELSASRRGVLVCRGERRQFAWVTDGAVGGASVFASLLQLARSQHRLMKIGFPPVSAETEAMAMRAGEVVQEVRQEVRQVA